MAMPVSGPTPSDTIAGELERERACMGRVSGVLWSVFPLDGENEALMQAANRRMLRQKRNAQRLASDARVVG